MTDEAIGTAQRRVDQRPNADQAARHGKLQVVLLCVQTDDATHDRFALVLPFLVSCHDTRPYLYLLTDTKYTHQNRAARHTSLELIDFAPGLVDIEGANDDQPRVRGKVPYWDRDSLDDVFVNGVDVELELSGDGDNRGAFGDGALDEGYDAFVVFFCC